MPSQLVPQKTPEEEELARKLIELAALEEELARRELDLATLLSELHHFERKYLRRVGRLYAELDELLAKKSEAEAEARPDDASAREEAERARARAEESAEAAEDGPLDTTEEATSPSENLRDLYRTVAKSLHPDLTTDQQERARRTTLMSQVNQAYEERDEGRLREILQEWKSGPEGVTGDGPGAALVRVIRKIAQVRGRLVKIEQQAETARESMIFKLKARVEEAASEGRNLLEEMADALRGQIDVVNAELAAMRAENAAG